jgi:carboxyl-terminal processing protease
MSARARLFVAFVSTGLIGFLLAGAVAGRVFGDTAYGQLTLFNEVLRHVLDGYVDALTPERLDSAMEAADMGLMDALDGDTAYLGPEDWRAYREKSAVSEAETGIALGRRFGFLMVIATRPGSPADKAGVRAGDFLKTIDDRHTRSISIAVGDRLLRGAPGSEVKLRVLRSRAEPIEFSIVRERLTATPVERRVLGEGNGYIHVTDFEGDAAREIRDAVESLKRAGIRNLVLDLRGASFGPLEQGSAAAQLFVQSGVVARLAPRSGAEQTTSADPAKVAWEGPLVTLVNGGTSGPGEVLTAALADSGRSSTVGQKTFGRVGVQRDSPLDDGGLIVTVSRYISPKGTAIHGKGIEPSVVVALAAPGSLATSDDDDDEAPEAEKPGPQANTDPVLDKALEVLKTGVVKKAA